MKTIIHRLLKGKIVLLFFVISSSLYFLMLFVTIPHLHQITKGTKILDMMPAGYDLVYAKQLMEALGETGRQYYLYRQIPIDLFFPFFFAASNSLISLWLVKKMGKIDSRWFYLGYFPFLPGVFDYIENFSIISILKNYPDISERAVSFCNIFSVLKSTTTTISICILLLILISFLLRKKIK